MQSLTRPIFNARFFVDLRCLAACLLVSLFLAAPRNAAAADRDLATLLPADTLVAAEWSHLGGGPNDWLAALASAAKSPFGKELFGHEQSSIARLLGVLRDGAHGPGAAAITLDGDKPQF